MAIPATAACQVLSSADLQRFAPRHITRLRYAPHVRVYASRPATEDANVGVHLTPVQKRVGTIEFFSGRRGAWGSCPADRQWALVCAHVDASAAFIKESKGTVQGRSRFVTFGHFERVYCLFRVRRESRC